MPQRFQFSTSHREVHHDSCTGSRFGRPVVCPPRVADAASAEQENAALKKQAADLERELEQLEAEHARLQAELAARNQQIAKLISKKAVASANAPAGAAGNKPGKPDWFWNIDARTMTRSFNVTAGGQTSTVTTTYQDRLQTFGKFINKSKAPYRFRMKIVIYKRLSVPTKNPPILGSATYVTPTLQPRQGVNINQVVTVSSITSPRLVRIVDVQPIPVK